MAVAVGNDNDNDRAMVHVAFPSMTRFQNLTRANDYAEAHDGDEQDGCVDEKEENNKTGAEELLLLLPAYNSRNLAVQLKKCIFSLFDRQIPNSVIDSLPTADYPLWS